MKTQAISHTDMISLFPHTTDFYFYASYTPNLTFSATKMIMSNVA